MAAMHWKAQAASAGVPACNRNVGGLDTTDDPDAVTCGKAGCQSAVHAERRRREWAASEDVEPRAGIMARTPAGALVADLCVHGVTVRDLGILELDAIATAATEARRTLIARDPEGYNRAMDIERDERIARWALEAEAAALAEYRDTAARQ